MTKAERPLVHPALESLLKWDFGGLGRGWVIEHPGDQPQMKEQHEHWYECPRCLVLVREYKPEQEQP